MRRTVLTAALLLAAVPPAAALDLGRWLPSIDLPIWPRIEIPDSRLPAPSAVRDPAARADPLMDTATGAEADPAAPSTPSALDPALAVDRREVRRVRPRGWRGLLPGSLK